MEHQIIIVGIGPGSPDYLIPLAKREIDKARVLVGSQRALTMYASSAAETCVIDRDIEGVLDFIGEKLQINNVVVLVSGDPGFYSMLPAVRRRFAAERIRVIPGISSAQIAFARIGEPWQNATLISMHGRSADDEAIAYKPGNRLGILTDGKNNPSAIASLLMAAGWPKTAKVWICTHLSYENEQVVAVSLQQTAELAGYDHCVMVVIA